jgi:hypothetical protein
MMKARLRQELVGAIYRGSGTSDNAQTSAIYLSERGERYCSNYF